MVLTYIFVGLVGVYTALAAVVDIRLHRIPNYLTVPTALLGLSFHSFISDWGTLTSLAGFAVGFGLLLLPWLLGGGGMGDVKLLAALGTWLGPTYMLVAFVASIFLAALIALGVLAKVACTKGAATAKRNYLSTGNGDQGNRTKRRKRMRVVPFAVPVAMSTWILLGWLITHGGILLSQV